MFEKNLKKIFKMIFKNNQNKMSISVLLLITLIIFLYKMPYQVTKLLHNKLITMLLTLLIGLNLTLGNYYISLVLLNILIIISHFHSNNINVLSYNHNSSNKYIIQDNSIFSQIKNIIHGNNEYMTTNSENTPTNTQITTPTTTGVLESKRPSGINSGAVLNSTKDIYLETAPETSETPATSETPVTTDIVQGFDNKTESVVESNNSNDNNNYSEYFTNAMELELFDAQSNQVPEHTKVDNIQSPIIGSNEYCSQGELSNGMPIGFDSNCQKNCSSV